MSRSVNAILMALCLSPLTALAEVHIAGPVEYGLFQSPVAEYAAGERLLTQNTQAIEQTTLIPARLGSRFGLRYSLKGKQPGEAPLTLLYLTPGITTPDGLRHDKIVLEQPLAANASQDVMAFEFSEPYEVVAGTWEFMVFQGDRLLARQSFEVR
ncbi:DUF3859 domain-containing protein [Pseudomonas sp. N040]|uniref:DUF3859 domain-containing protein n=1 Tax=Pseudomonas sp. N040 TaxID=2785325 RepID=UPI0018A2C37D|nr:DUF3859 domain-containing protein [Pseudomonas sp. N040]MBF7731091.1 DUF3859 domain-containing protein [Pseudomonas sp. N040]MBW7014734.1 DUF3859 domain-containing protein [Pseudomonas sp. N040]